MAFVILGCGYTGVRVAERLLRRGEKVIATTRSPGRLSQLAAAGAEVIEWDAARSSGLEFIPEGAAILYSIPLVETPSGPQDRTPEILAKLPFPPRRLVYLSTTGVYGAARDIDEFTPAAPRSAREHLRTEAERAVLGGPWTSLVLRPAAIYGPGRGIHVSLARGDFRLLGDGQNFVSRIHVEDLAEQAVAALLSELTGAYPVADEEPCTSFEIARFCAELLGLPMPPVAEAAELHHTRGSNRRVDGSAIRKLLRITLRYPSYRVGIPASL
ncbi:MAG TPA: NAD-dependent epimerase/dehydratase family protein [Bryobacteraceae bacterium]|nr:NAD-dependent epimerase/dehydratase family protein [Bryobacteraceae bacterium]